MNQVRDLTDTRQPNADWTRARVQRNAEYYGAGSGRNGARGSGTAQVRAAAARLAPVDAPFEKRLRIVGVIGRVDFFLLEFARWENIDS